MTPRLSTSLGILVLVCAGLSSPQAQDVQPNGPPVISHEPVTKAMKGQALTMKAKVTDDKGAIESVTLFYTLSKDAAPFKVALKPAGLDYFIGTIDAGVLSGVATVSYYIEAQDRWGATRETPWYMVSFREPRPSEIAAPAGAAPAKIQTPTGEKEKDGSISKGLIVGGAVAVIGGALLISDSGGGSSGGGGGGGGGDVGTKQGTYVGTVTTCLTLSGSPPSCESHTCTIVIDASGKVLSSDIRAGQQLTDTLSGNEFTLIASADDADAGITGEIFYNGTVVSDTKIVGSVTGSQQGLAGAGTYSGSFSATKQ